jgi:hypothetical protein
MIWKYSWRRNWAVVRLAFPLARIGSEKLMDINAVSQPRKQAFLLWMPR